MVGDFATSPPGRFRSHSYPIASSSAAHKVGYRRIVVGPCFLAVDVDELTVGALECLGYDIRADPDHSHWREPEITMEQRLGNTE
jgi:hypothetical protein